MRSQNNFTKLIDHWPQMLLVAAGVLTIAWVSLVIWLSLRLLNLV